MRQFAISLLFLGLAATSTARGPITIEYKTPALKVLGLYDSTDGPHGADVVLKQRVEPVLKALGLTLVIHDIRTGLPPTVQMPEFRAIITVFDDAAMPNASVYLKWLAGQVAGGKRLVILNNMGAYQDSGTGKWTDWGEVNRVLKSLGVAYQAKWTDKRDQLHITKHDSARFEPETLPDLTGAQHYYKFKPTGADMDVHLMVQRKDIEEGDSAVVFTSTGGGMALDRYFETLEKKPLLRLAPFLEKALFPKLKARTRVLIALGPESSDGHRMEINLHWILKYSRIHADFIRFSDLERIHRRDLRQYGALVLASYGSGFLERGQALTDIEQWVREDGGGLVSLFPVRRPEWDKMLGIKKWTDKADKYAAMKYGAGFYPGLEGLYVRGDAYDGDIHPAVLTKDTELLAWGTQEKNPNFKGAPVLWRRRHGQGRVVFRNDGALTQKVWRGSALQMILQGLPIAAAPLINARVYFVDDCPQPMWGTKRGSVQKDYDLSDTDFYKNVWWKDLMAMAKDFDVKMTFVLIFSYDIETKKNFSTQQFYAPPTKGVPTWMAQEALRLGHEMGFHGYNHQSLVRNEGYTSKGWTLRQDMVDALLLARKEWQRLFGPGTAPFTYIAPNNHIHRLGKDAVRIAFPEARVLAAQYLSERTDAVDIEGHEFGPDPDVPHFVNMPRTSSEFYLGQHNNVAIHDGIMLAGVWTHFVHPDDVYDPDRNGGFNWAQLNEEARKMLKHIGTSYPWLKSKTARSAYQDIIRYRSGAFSTRLIEGGLEVNLGDAAGTPTPFVIHIDPDKRIDSVVNGKILHSYEKLGYYYVEGRGPKTRVMLVQP